MAVLLQSHTGHTNGVPEPEVAIRPASPDDAEALTLLHLDCWDDAYTGMIPQQRLDARRRHVEDRIADRRKALAHEAEVGRRTLLAGIGGPQGEHLVGFVAAGPNRTLHDHPHLPLPPSLEVYALYVRATHWGTGVGRLLLGAATDDGPCSLWVLDRNDRARRFYARQGLVADGAVDRLPEGEEVRLVRR